jgi:hypothetical protein
MNILYSIPVTKHQTTYKKQLLWCTPAIPASGKQRQEFREFEVSKTLPHKTKTTTRTKLLRRRKGLL